MACWRRSITAVSYTHLGTDAYREYEQRRKNGQDMQSSAKGLMDLFAQIGALRHLSPAGEQAQKQIRALQDFISEHFYTCTKQILSGLGEMYTGCLLYTSRCV